MFNREIKNKNWGFGSVMQGVLVKGYFEVEREWQTFREANTE